MSTLTAPDRRARAHQREHARRESGAERRDLLRRARLRAASEVARADAITTGRDVLVSEVAQRARRRARYQLRDVAQSITKRDRLRDCGRKRVAPNVALRLGSRGAGFAGVAYCQSIWACPTCSAAIRNERAREIQEGARRHLAGGGGGLFVTLTVPHGRLDKLRDLLRVICGGWGAMLDDRAGREWRKRLGLVGYIRAVEVTDGESGWHPHLHLLVLTSGAVGDDMREAFTSWLQERWMRYNVDKDWGDTGGKYGADVQDIVGTDGLARYVAKVQDDGGVDRVLGVELARADLKSARGKGRTPFEILAAIHELRRGNADPDERKTRALVARWREFEAETAGLSALRWSVGLRDKLGISERSDAEIVNDLDLGDDTRTIVSIPAVDWHILCRRGARGELLETAERFGAKAASEFIAGVVDADVRDWLAAIDECWADDPR